MSKWGIDTLLDIGDILLVDWTVCRREKTWLERLYKIASHPQ